jgi:hypothetical protein
MQNSIFKLTMKTDLVSYITDTSSKMEISRTISRDELRTRTQLTYKMKSAIDDAVRSITKASDKGQYSCFIPMYEFKRAPQPSSLPEPELESSAILRCLKAKFPECLIEYNQDDWITVDATTRRKMTGIRIDWS